MAAAMLAADAKDMHVYSVVDHFLPYEIAKPAGQGWNTKRRHSHFFLFNAAATTEIYTLSLHDALPIPWHPEAGGPPYPAGGAPSYLSAGDQEIGRAHVSTPVTVASRMPTSSSK